MLSANDNYSHLKLYLVASSHRHGAIMSRESYARMCDVRVSAPFSVLQSFHKNFAVALMALPFFMLPSYSWPSVGLCIMCDTIG